MNYNTNFKAFENSEEVISLKTFQYSMDNTLTSRYLRSFQPYYSHNLQTFNFKIVKIQATLLLILENNYIL